MNVDNLIGFVYDKEYKKINKCVKSNIDINIKDEDERTLLMHAVLDTEHDLNMIRYLLELGIDVNARDKQNWTALHFACQSQKADIITILLNNNAEINIVDSFGNSPLWRAVMNGRDNIDLIKLLLKHGANPFQKNSHNNSAYDIAKRTRDSVLTTLFENYKSIDIQ